MSSGGQSFPVLCGFLCFAVCGFLVAGCGWCVIRVVPLCRFEHFEPSRKLHRENTPQHAKQASRSMLHAEKESTGRNIYKVFTR